MGAPLPHTTWLASPSAACIKRWKGASWHAQLCSAPPIAKTSPKVQKECVHPVSPLDSVPEGLS